MRRWTSLLLVSLLALMLAAPASAAPTVTVPTAPLPDRPSLPNPVISREVTKLAPIPVAFGAVANRYTNVDPATTFDLNGDLVGDLKVTSTEVLAQNGAQLLYMDPPALNLDEVNVVPAAGYTAKATMQLSRVYVMKLAGGYAKFMVRQATPKVTLWFMYGTQTSSTLQADGTGSHAVLTWDALPDAALGYNVYRYQIDDNSYMITTLNDFTVQETTFVDETAENRYYIYLAQAIKADGHPGTLTTTAPVFVQHQLHSLKVSLQGGPALRDNQQVAMAVKPVVKHGLMMVPASILQQAGVTSTVEAATGRITLSRRIGSVTYTVVMTVDSPDYTWNGQPYKSDVPPYKSGTEVMVPLRVVAPALGLGVTFNSVERTANIGWYE